MEIVNFTANKFLCNLTQEQRNNMNTIIFMDDRSSISIDGQNVCMSFTDISFLEMEEIIYQLPNIHHLVYKIETDTDGWSDLLVRCLNYYDDIHSVDLGNLILREKHVKPFHRHTRRLTVLSLHCADVDYVFWLYIFLSEMNIINLYVHNFSIPQNEILVTKQYFIISRSCIDRAKVRGTIHFVLPDCASTQIHLFSYVRYWISILFSSDLIRDIRSSEKYIYTTYS